jgi:hypothetical protein
LEKTILGFRIKKAKRYQQSGYANHEHSTDLLLYFHRCDLLYAAQTITKHSTRSIFLAGTSLFWLIRTIQQLVFFKTKNRIMNMLTMTFLIGAVLFALAVIR